MRLPSWIRERMIAEVEKKAYEKQRQQEKRDAGSDETVEQDDDSEGGDP